MRMSREERDAAQANIVHQIEKNWLEKRLAEAKAAAKKCAKAKRDAMRAYVEGK